MTNEQERNRTEETKEASTVEGEPGVGLMRQILERRPLTGRPNPEDTTGLEARVLYRVPAVSLPLGTVDTDLVPPGEVSRAAARSSGSGTVQAMVTAVGADKPGNLAHVAHDIFAMGGTILACSMTVLQARTAMILVAEMPTGVSQDELREALNNSRDFGLEVVVTDLAARQREGLDREWSSGTPTSSIPWHFSGHAADQRGMIASVTQVLVDAGLDITRAVARVINRVGILDIDILIPEDKDAQFLPARLATALPSRSAGLLTEGMDPRLVDTLESGPPEEGAWIAPPILIPGRHGVSAYRQQWSGRWAGDFVITAIGDNALHAFNGIARGLLPVLGNIEAASVVVLQGRAAVMLVVSTPAEVTEAQLFQAVSATKEGRGLELTYHDIRGPVPEREHPDYNIGQRWHFVGHVAEQPGILYRVAQLFAESDINICEASSDVIGTPPLCTIDLDVVVRESVPFATVCGKYTELASSLGFVKADLWQVEES